MRTLDAHWTQFALMIPDGASADARTLLRLAWFHGANAALDEVSQLALNRKMSAEVISAVLMGMADEIGAQIKGTAIAGRRAD